ncbi:MAG: TetR/AcrR family transcriptional regulator [Nocardioides sp.]|nr:TetR/AcrR family transcriptional regulator [Nocardioides sp.]
MTETAGTLTDRRRAATRLTIAVAALRLFAEQGLTATTVEEVAASAGVGLRTFYRYFPSKQDAIVPLLTRGAEAWRAELADIPTGAPLREAVAGAIATRFTPAGSGDSADLELTRGLMRTVAGDRDLQRVWHDVNGDSERRLVPVFADLTGDHEGLAPRLLASAATDAIRLALEIWSAPDAPDEPGPAEIARECFARLTEWYDDAGAVRD